MIVLTPCYYPDTKPIHYLVDSCKKFTLNLQPYGVGEKFTGFWDAKVRDLRYALSRVKDEYTLFVDGVDSFAAAGEKAIMEAYERVAAPRKSQLVFSGDACLYPLRRLHPEFLGCAHRWGRGEFGGGAPFPFPCAGAFMGKTQYILEQVDELIRFRAMTEMPERWMENDQAWWSLALAKRAVWYTIDYRGQFMLSLHKTKKNWFDRSQGTCRVKATGEHPCVLHFNGAGRYVRHYLPEFYKEMLG